MSFFRPPISFAASFSACAVAASERGLPHAAAIVATTNSRRRCERMGQPRIEGDDFDEAKMMTLEARVEVRLQHAPLWIHTARADGRHHHLRIARRARPS